MGKPPHQGLRAWAVLLGGLLAAPASPQPWGFVDVTAAAGVDYAHGFVDPSLGPLRMAGGVAAGDYDDDGWIDLFVVRGDIGPDLLFRNRGDGTFEEVGAAAGVAGAPRLGCGPTFADLDGDGHLDLVIGGMEFTPLLVFRNRGDGTFEDVSANAGFTTPRFAFGPAFGDFDRDGDLDAFVPQWNNQEAELIWRNEGGFVFSPATAEVLDAAARAALLFTFTPNFSDVNDDGWPDLLVAADFNNSQVLLNDGSGRFDLVTNEEVIIETNGMGAAVADFDGDSRLDWFVSSIGATTQAIGNRLYRGLGDGTFEDVTPAAGVSQGFWGWGACAADFDNDGDPDIFHVNGFAHMPFETDPSRLFVNGGDGTFSEQALARGIDDRREGRGVACFDFDRDGDLDIFVANNSSPPRLYRNDGGNDHAFLAVTLQGPEPNPFGVGAQIVVETADALQRQETRAGNNFVSNNPVVAQFGLGEQTMARRLTVIWPNDQVTQMGAIRSNQEIRVPWSWLFLDGFESGDLAAWGGGT